MIDMGFNVSEGGTGHVRVAPISIMGAHAIKCSDIDTPDPPPGRVTDGDSRYPIAGCCGDVQLEATAVDPDRGSRRARIQRQVDSALTLRRLLSDAQPLATMWTDYDRT
ncbi:hypothetical protein Aca07nite_64650 [Actinoplanes capillaceus]|uniref:Uncharacterized protein n=1 Tax=Actinoplanes campanulatus TaxID=113559 RepID=A0ABQ3WSG3_9ACTN|nr:hypothetical protein Aca07nite_64650 [Actinoplanes capillaceus]